MNAVIFHSIWTVLMLVAFIALVVWVMRGKQKKVFDDAARIPLEDEVNDHDATPTQSKEPS